MDKSTSRQWRLLNKRARGTERKRNRENERDVKREREREREREIDTVRTNATGVNDGVVLQSTCDEYCFRAGDATELTHKNAEESRAMRTSCCFRAGL